MFLVLKKWGGMLYGHLKAMDRRLRHLLCQESGLLRSEALRWGGHGSADVCAGGVKPPPAEPSPHLFFVSAGRSPVTGCRLVPAALLLCRGSISWRPAGGLELLSSSGTAPPEPGLGSVSPEATQAQQSRPRPGQQTGNRVGQTLPLAGQFLQGLRVPVGERRL